MGIIYRYLASSTSAPPNGASTAAAASPSSQRTSLFTTRVYFFDRLIPRKKQKDDLSATCIRAHDMLYNSLLFAAHNELIWWLRLNFCNYRRNRGWILPRTDFDSMMSWLEWKLYWKRFKQRAWPAVFEYQTTLSIMHFLQALLRLIVSTEAMNRLTQHPYHRALAVSSRDSDRVAVGVDSVVTTLWANLLFFSASFTSGQLTIIFNYHRNKVRKTKEEADKIFLMSTWGLGWTIARRYYSSAIGAGLGSIVWPGFGTILGMGLGDGIAELTPEPELPKIDGGGPFSFSVKRVTLRGKQPLSNYGDDASESLKLEEELTCGCCQIVAFSSDPSSSDRAPISSRECGHTICKSCVQKCHLTLMERASTYQEWISCPICKAHNAFSSHNHLVNRGLCDAISLIEKKTAFRRTTGEEGHSTQAQDWFV